MSETGCGDTGRTLSTSFNEWSSSLQTDHASTTSSGLGRVVVLAGEAGSVGGAARAAMLLCEEALALASAVELFVTLPPDRQTRERLDAKGVAVTVSPLQSGWRFLLPARALALRLALHCLRNPVSLVHSVGLSAEAADFLALRPRVPVLLWETTEALPGIKFSEPRIGPHLSAVATVLCPSATVASNFRNTYSFRGRISILPFWAERPSSPTIAATRRREFLYCGRIDEDKGLDTLIEAFKRVTVSHPDTRLRICGGGNLAYASALARGVAGVLLEGRVEDEALDAALRSSHYMVLPSRHEGYPITLLEACGRGTPFISTRVGSIPEVFEGRPCAVLVPPGDVDALATAMIDALEERDFEYETRSANARSTFEELNSAAAIARNLENAYAPFLAIGRAGLPQHGGVQDEPSL